MEALVSRERTSLWGARSHGMGRDSRGKGKLEGVLPVSRLQGGAKVRVSLQNSESPFVMKSEF